MPAICFVNGCGDWHGFNLDPAEANTYAEDEPPICEFYQSWLPALL